MRHEKYITFRKGKKGNSYQIKIPYGNGKDRQWYTETIRCNDYSTPSMALEATKKARDGFLLNKRSSYHLNQLPTVEQLYLRSESLFVQTVSTHERHDSVYRHSIVSYQDTPIDKITAVQIQESLNNYAQTHTQDRVARVFSLWQQIYRTAAFLGYNIADLTLRVQIPKSKVVKKMKSTSISKEDFDKFCDCLLQYRLENGKSPYFNRMVWYMLQIMYYTGCRPAEALALTKSDVSFEPPAISISKAVGSTKDSKHVIVPTKTSYSRRTVPMDASLVPIMHTLVSQSVHDYLISEQNGQLMNIDEIDNLIHRVSVSSKIPFNAYRLRHKFSTDMVKITDARTTQDLMGHASFNMSLEYANSTEQDKQQAIKNRKI